MYPHTSQRRRKQLWSDWRKLCAFGLTATYSMLFLFAALCFATGIFHPDVHDDHAGSAHHHTDADTHHPSMLLDICEFAWQALTATAWHMAQLPEAALSQGDTVRPPYVPVVLTKPGVSPSSRAPPPDTRLTVSKWPLAVMVVARCPEVDFADDLRD